MIRELPPENILKARLDIYSEAGAESPQRIIDDGYRSMTLILPGDQVWSTKGLVLYARRESALLFTINGDVTVHTPEIATARLRFFDQTRWKNGFELGRDRSIGAANVILGHFMFDNVEETPGMVINGLRACLQKSLGDGVTLPS